MNIYKLLEQTRQACAENRLSRKTENAYLNHIRSFIKFSGESESDLPEKHEIEEFLEYLTRDKHLAAATRNQARCAIIFFCRRVLQTDAPFLNEIKRARQTFQLPEVLTTTEARKLLANLYGAARLTAALMYGAGLRISEAIRLRVRDIDFARDEIIVRHTRTGAKERVTILPAALVGDLQRHLRDVRYIFEDDKLDGVIKACLSETLRQKYPRGK